MATKYCPQYAVDYLKEHAGKKTAAEMAAELKITRGAVYQYCGILDIDTTLDSDKAKWKKIDEALMIYGGSKTISQIAHLINETAQSVWHRSRKLKLCGREVKDDNYRISRVLNGIEVFDYTARENWLL